MLLIEPIVRRALEDDFGRAGDVTSDLIIPEDQSDIARLVARAPGTLAGLACAQCAFRLIDSSASMDVALQDSSLLASGETIATIAGKTRAILGAERVALNFLGHLSGVATATRQLVDAVAGTKARIVCTRKTTPGLNILEKYAVRCGGGYNHRFGLDDAVLIKDNHIAAAGGIPAAVERVRRGLGHMVEVEVEVDTLEQLDEALSLGVRTILLDNMTPAELRDAVRRVAKRAVLEASGGITIETVRAIAETGVDYISSGAITHSARSLDIGLDL
jgi:nicotinate-nucleotide pyrophosphorylase (carboxylating)